MLHSYTHVLEIMVHPPLILEKKNSWSAPPCHVVGSHAAIEKKREKYIE